MASFGGFPVEKMRGTVLLDRRSWLQLFLDSTYYLDLLVLVLGPSFERSCGENEAPRKCGELEALSGVSGAAGGIRSGSGSGTSG